MFELTYQSVVARYHHNLLLTSFSIKFLDLDLAGWSKTWIDKSLARVIEVLCNSQYFFDSPARFSVVMILIRNSVHTFEVL
jgi:hypothetical protein